MLFRSAQDTVFGFMVSGSWSNSHKPSSLFSHQLLCCDIDDLQLCRFWDLESIGICDQDVGGPSQVLDKFEESVCYSDGRYEVALPWKDEKSSQRLMNNEKLAEARLKNLSRKLAKDPDLEK